MSNTLVPVKKQITPPSEFNYLQTQPNFYPTQAISRIEEPLLFSAFLTTEQITEHESVTRLPDRIKPKTDLPLTSDYGEVGFPQMVSICGPLRAALQYV